MTCVRTFWYSVHLYFNYLCPVVNLSCKKLLASHRTQPLPFKEHDLASYNFFLFYNIDIIYVTYLFVWIPSSIE